ncbi:helix-turn-helix domain-containing protein [Tissierella carlieri]|uniref:Helix-turn-helix domain-containing protein n=1 Tax=Tissierella carlieri TaxID=689904 RepID=A0ABT1SF03_9FIRM|nr:helix-turn-helix transcriptional regulator [Tissierella carlieri]MCQ4925045.1 helix-turn-helix domain-containing protein [Tissierella carlieri]
MVTIGERIKKIRLDLNMNQIDFCSKIGITQGSLSEIESNNNNPSINTLIAIHTMFNVDFEYLLLGVIQKEQPINKILRIYESLSEKDKEVVERVAEGLSMLK